MTPVERLREAAAVPADDVTVSRTDLAAVLEMSEYGQHDAGCYAMESRQGEAAACKCGFYDARAALRGDHA